MAARSVEWGSGLKEFVDNLIKNISENDEYSTASIRARSDLIKYSRRNNEVLDIIKAAAQNDRRMAEKLGAILMIRSTSTTKSPHGKIRSIRPAVESNGNLKVKVKRVSREKKLGTSIDSLLRDTPPTSSGLETSRDYYFSKREKKAPSVRQTLKEYNGNYIQWYND